MHWGGGGGALQAALGVSSREFKGQHDRGNRTESLSEGILPLRGSLRGRVFRGVQRILEVFRGFHRFLEGFAEIFQRSSQRPSQRQISLSEALSPHVAR